jgi:hypothetical protein
LARALYEADKGCLQTLVAAEQHAAPNGSISAQEIAQYWSRRSDVEQRIRAYEAQHLLAIAEAREPCGSVLEQLQAGDASHTHSSEGETSRDRPVAYIDEEEKLIIENCDLIQLFFDGIIGTHSFLPFALHLSVSSPRVLAKTFVGLGKGDYALGCLTKCSSCTHN